MSASTLLAAPLVIAGVLALSGQARIADQRSDPDSGSGIRALRDLHVPDALVRDWVVTAHPIAEVLVALGLILLPTPWRWVAAAAAVTLMAAYTVLVTAAVRRARAVNCTCFGRRSEVVNRRTVVRNVALLALALLAVADCLEPAAPVVRVFGGLDALVWTAILAITAGVAWLIGRGYAAHPPSVDPVATGAGRGLTGTGGGLGSDADGDGAEGDGDGRAPIPDQTLTAADGSRTTLTDLVAERAAVLLFLEPTCGSCTRLLDQLSAWRTTIPEISLVPVRVRHDHGPGHGHGHGHHEQGSDGHGHHGHGRADGEGSGGAGSDREGSGGEPFEGVEGGYWADHEIIDAFGTMGFTPWAVLLGADGLVAGGPVAGYPAVRAFLAEVLAHLTGLA